MRWSSSSIAHVRRGPGFALDATNTPAVAEICRRLDGIPLAIQLAAARVVSMSPTEIVALLDERFRLLTGGRRSAVERHQTLRAAVDWSYSLLTEAEQLVFARLGVFSSSFTATDATAVVTGDGIDAWDVIDVIGSLVAKSMLIADEHEDGATRYRELETLRQYARIGSRTPTIPTCGAGATPGTSATSPNRPVPASTPPTSSRGGHG